MDATIKAEERLAALTGLLDLEGFEVVEASEDRARKVRRQAVVAGLCPHCGSATGDRHAYHDREVVDLPLGGWGTELAVRGWQFRCDHCRKFFTPRHPALAEGRTPPSGSWSGWRSWPPTATSPWPPGSSGFPRRRRSGGTTSTSGARSG